MIKDELRAKMREMRRNLPADEVTEKSAVIARSLLGISAVKDARTVCVYLSALKEPDTRGIIGALLSAGKRVAVPVTDEENVTLSLSYIDNASELARGAYGIYEPTVIRRADENDIDVIVTPGLAFDKRGGRMGFGKGYYDRLFEKTDTLRIALCYDFQLLDKIPTEPHDAPMDIIVTEKRVLVIQSGSQHKR